jgi:glycine/D-amino acid oxidase-like deaminating enzyme
MTSTYIDKVAVVGTGVIGASWVAYFFAQGHRSVAGRTRASDGGGGPPSDARAKRRRVRRVYFAPDVPWRSGRRIARRRIRQDDPGSLTLTPALIQQVVDGVKAELASRSVASIEATRDRLIRDLLNARRDSADTP